MSLSRSSGAIGADVAIDASPVVVGPTVRSHPREGALAAGTMNHRSRTLIALAVVMLAGTFLFPLWNIYLTAPQYPEGLGMQIWLNTVRGIGANDLDNINNLNHYIGMKRIVPETIPELRFMPYIVTGIMLLGALSVWRNRRSWAMAWVGTFALIAIIGLIDFYKWEYDYGHNLDMENAIIKVPGMSYQPPLIGSKQLLNFTAASVPGPGGWLAIGALACGVLAVAIANRPNGRRPESIPI